MLAHRLRPWRNIETALCGYKSGQELYMNSAPDNMRISVKYACKKQKNSLIENLRSIITH